MHGEDKNTDLGRLEQIAVRAVPTADQFIQTFARCYRECRGLYSDEEFTNQIWGLWPEFFFNPRKPTNQPKLKSDTSVIARVALALNLEYWNETLRLDGVFHQGEAECGFPFPIMVAFEHEEDPRSFANEIMKLLSVRCPLKVGITHTTNKDIRAQMTSIQQKISEKFWRVRSVTMEDPRTEYLFMIGSQEKPKDPSWYYLSFDAGDGPGAQNFERIGGIG